MSKIDLCPAVSGTMRTPVHKRIKKLQFQSYITDRNNWSYLTIIIVQFLVTMS